jgi:hypothetical protein
MSYGDLESDAGAVAEPKDVCLDAQAVFASSIASISRPLHRFIARSIRVAERPR